MSYEMIILAASAVIAMLVGFLTGVFGVGGGFLMAPALMLIGVSAPLAVGTGVAAMLINAGFGMFKRRGSGTVDAKLALTLSLGSFAGVMIGTILMEFLKQLPPLMILGREHTAVTYVLFCIFFVILVGLTVFLAIDSRKRMNDQNAKHKGKLAGMNVGPVMRFDSLDVGLPLIPLVLLGLFIGILTGLLGIGGGVLILPALVYLVGQTANKAAGTSLLVVFISSAIAAVIHGKNGNIDPTLWLVLATGGTIGTNIGTHVGLKTEDGKLRGYFIYVVAAAALIVGFKIYIMTFASPPTH